MWTLRNLGGPIKILFTCILFTIGPGYFFALTYLFLMDVQPHAEEGGSMVEAVMDKYYGRRDVTALEASLIGGMGDEVTDAEKQQLVQWARSGAPESEYAAVGPLITNNCAVCHNHEDMPGAPLTTYAEVTAYTVMDTGISAKTLVRVSHIHVFGLTFLFTIVSGIFVLSEAKSSWRGVIVAIPFLAIWIDVGSWWFTRVNPVFAYTVMIGGALAGFSLGIQIFLSLYEMWLLPPTVGRPSSQYVANAVQAAMAVQPVMAAPPTYGPAAAVAAPPTLAPPGAVAAPPTTGWDGRPAAGAGVQTMPAQPAQPAPAPPPPPAPAPAPPHQGNEPADVPRDVQSDETRGEEHGAGI